MKKYIKLLRPYQWIKNLFRFAGVAFGFHFTDGYLPKAIMGFIVFCAAASSVYVLNDTKNGSITIMKIIKLIPENKFKKMKL
jgi:4-hydroxybenzoate polyprenyltransferase